MKKVTYSAGYSGVPLSFGYQVPKKGIGSEETQADVCCLGKFPKYGRVSEVFYSWTTIYQGYHNLIKEQRSFCQNIANS